MASIAKLFRDTKYADSIIECDGQLLFCHRAIVCCRSEVLAVEFDDECQVCLLSESERDVRGVTREQGTDGKPIPHNLFDYSTLERMLQFIYEGDYTVSAVSLQPETADTNGTAATNEDAAKCVPPHRRHESARESLNFRLMADDQTAREVPFNSMLQCCNCSEITYGRRIP
jgi:hypothetical protein